MKISASIFSAFIAGTITASAFVAPRVQAPVAFTRSSDVTAKASSALSNGNMSDELDIPCDDECAVGSYANLPPSVHPGVVSGQAQVDLLEHAKANGTFRHLEPFEIGDDLYDDSLYTIPSGRVD